MATMLGKPPMQFFLKQQAAWERGIDLQLFGAPGLDASDTVLHVALSDADLHVLREADDIDRRGGAGPSRGDGWGAYIGPEISAATVLRASKWLFKPLSDELAPRVAVWECRLKSCDYARATALVADWFP
ncbi:hypothetical protein MKK88_22050 [Methylobacterium sp. E-005]|nr:hypothetical protein [Methylobacterium sp. E-005]MCJ2088640.1 hypothetical protein [Methylobacterium sp. E-005]